MKRVYSILILLLAATAFKAAAQEDSKTKVIIIESEEDGDTKTDSVKKKRTKTISIGNGGIVISDSDDKKEKPDTIKVTKEDKVFDMHIGLLDLGFLNFSDKTDYGSAETRAFLGNVGPDKQNENLFSLREGKSINVTIYPVLAKYRLLKTDHQKLFLSFGAGLQIYNFRFNKPITYTNETRPTVLYDSTTHFSKNKLGVSYLTIPLMLTAKTKLAKGVTLVYGAGITAGYRIASWTKQVSDERGKEKNRDPFNFNNFNTTVTAEFGLESYFRLYGSYQLTALHKDGLQQYPYSIGVRFLGI